MNQLINITQNENNESVVSGRELHEFLEVGTRYSIWFDRMVEYGFTENTDYLAIVQKRTTAQGNQTEYTDHALKLDMAKEISMIQRTAKGKEARQYFIQVEKEYKRQQVPLTLDQQIAAIATGYGSVKEELVEVKDQVADLTNRFGLPSNKAKALSKRVGSQIYMFLGGKDSNAYKAVSRKLFREFYKDLNNYFDVVKYSDIPLSRFEEALDYVRAWHPSTNIALEIRNLNSQTSLINH